ncbi:Lipopolysaccharide core heptosyltransferase RfaQ [Sodalis glossinidius str. 'morsitans']|uniref:Lipopolysaccharide heptosyltransferase 3 n=1 Tax=Sodalis glossinidius (strain morsitans) TaxID=343509 RepID=Q2NQU9_SODGM|nr:putative lipopolysaccharide heptosyltransferase III [Sodalis glossinidius]BAE75476.1 putative lipopolysaccharide glucosyltransferase [Sodalis glossinidius str. 'morsitans']CRL46542.1 Lipopolysaccharide core heptosyltransferase RfaQ [Sodalis glossinidius str. 'morsitans']
MPTRHDVTPAVPHKILLIKLRHHGDMILTTPVINNLLQHYPEAEIDVLLYKETAPILAHYPAIAHIHVIDREWKKQGLLRQLEHEYALAQTLRARHYDLVINLADQWRSAIVALLSGAAQRIGFDYTKRRSFLWSLAHNHLVTTADHARLHTVEQNLSILDPLNLAITDCSSSMYYATADKARGEALLREHQVMGDYIVIQPTSRWLYKCWDDTKMAQLIEGLATCRLPVVLTAGPDKHEQEMVAHIISLCRGVKPVNLAGQLSLPQLAAVIDGAHLFIGVDSAPMHMAAALNTPCVALFGPTKLQRWRPWSEKSIVLWAGDYTELPDPDTIDTQAPQRYLSAIPLEPVLAAAMTSLATEKPTVVRESAP